MDSLPESGGGEPERKPDESVSEDELASIPLPPQRVTDEEVELDGGNSEASSSKIVENDAESARLPSEMMVVEQHSSPAAPIEDSDGAPDVSMEQREHSPSIEDDRVVDSCERVPPRMNSPEADEEEEVVVEEEETPTHHPAVCAEEKDDEYGDERETTSTPVVGGHLDTSADESPSEEDASGKLALCGNESAPGGDAEAAVTASSDHSSSLAAPGADDEEGDYRRVGNASQVVEETDSDVDPSSERFAEDDEPMEQDGVDEDEQIVAVAAGDSDSVTGSRVAAEGGSDEGPPSAPASNVASEEASPAIVDAAHDEGSSERDDEAEKEEQNEETPPKSTAEPTCDEGKKTRRKAWMLRVRLNSSLHESEKSEEEGVVAGSTSSEAAAAEAAASRKKQPQSNIFEKLLARRLETLNAAASSDSEAASASPKRTSPPAPPPKSIESIRALIANIPATDAADTAADLVVAGESGGGDAGLAAATMTTPSPPATPPRPASDGSTGSAALRHTVAATSTFVPGAAPRVRVPPAAAPPRLSSGPRGPIVSRVAPVTSSPAGAAIAVTSPHAMQQKQQALLPKRPLLPKAPPSNFVISQHRLPAASPSTPPSSTAAAQQQAFVRPARPQHAFAQRPVQQQVRVGVAGGFQQRAVAGGGSVQQRKPLVNGITPNEGGLIRNTAPQPQPSSSQPSVAGVASLKPAAATSASPSLSLIVPTSKPRYDYKMHLTADENNILVAAGASPNGHTCAQCGDRFALLSGYELHMQRRSQMISIRCLPCQRSLIFFNPCRYRDHVATHAKSANANATIVGPNSLQIRPLTEEHKFGWMNGAAFKRAGDLKALFEHEFGIECKSIPASAAGGSQPLVGAQPTASTPAPPSVNAAASTTLGGGAGNRDASVQQQPLSSVNKALQPPTRPATASSVTPAPLTSTPATPMNAHSKDYSPSQQQQHTAATAVKCSECAQTFASADALRLHFAYNLPPHQKQFICQQCQAVYFSQCSYKAHCRTHAVGSAGPWICAECGQAATSMPTLTRHLLSHPTKPTVLDSWRCLKCNTFYSAYDALTAHVSGTHCETHHKCAACAKVFRTQSLFDEHRRIDHAAAQVSSETLLSCPHQQCNFMAREKAALIVHIRKHYSNDAAFQVYRCPVCGRLMENKGGLVTHYRNLHTINLESSAISEYRPQQERARLQARAVAAKTALSSAAAVAGTKQATAPSSNFYNCKHCKSMFFRSEDVLKKHFEQKHRFPCKFCARTLETHEERVADGLQHLRARQTVCLLCENQHFESPVRLAHHLACHLNGSNASAGSSAAGGTQLNPPFVCTIDCARRFTQRSEAVNHLRHLHHLPLLQCKECLALMESEKALDVHRWVCSQQQAGSRSSTSAVGSGGGLKRMAVGSGGGEASDVKRQRVDTSAASGRSAAIDGGGGE